jgi:protein involved in polysaccharide export with SLBB domain
MGWKSVLFGFAAVVALGFGSWGQSVSAPPVALRQSEPATQPRYATMIPPTREEDATAQPAPPIAAPTTRVVVSQMDPQRVDTANAATPQLRYSTMEQPRPIEQVTVTGLRPSDDTLYRLGTGDKLRVTVFNEADLTGEFQIDSQGYVRLPLIGPVIAAGLSTLGLESRIAETFVGGGYLVNPRVAVEIMSYRPFYITGEVSKPGEYAYVNAMSVPNAIALAGGYTERAVESDIWVRHQGESKEYELPADETTRIRPGDVIRVSRSTYWSIMTILAPIISPFATVAYLLK